MRFSMLVLCLGYYFTFSIIAGINGQLSERKNPTENVNCLGKNHLLIQEYYNYTDMDWVCGTYGMRPAQVTFNNFQEILDDLSGCIVGGKNRRHPSHTKQDDNTAWIGGIEGYGGCLMLDLLGPINWVSRCENIQHLVICQDWDVAIFETLTSTSTICPLPSSTTTTSSSRFHVAFEFTGRLELDVWQVLKNRISPMAKAAKIPRIGNTCGMNGIEILYNPMGYLDSRSACQNSNLGLVQLDLTPANYPLLQQIANACFGTESIDIWVNSFNGLGILNVGTNAPCGYVKISSGDPELVLLNDEGSCHFFPHLVACQSSSQAVTSIGPTPIKGTTFVTSYEVVTVSATRC